MRLKSAVSGDAKVDFNRSCSGDRSIVGGSVAKGSPTLEESQPASEMRPSRRRTVLVALIGTVTNTFVVSTQSIVITPICLYAIGPRLYGAWLGTGDVLVWLQAFDLGLPNLLIQRIGAAHGCGDFKTVGEHFATGLAILGVICVIGIGASGGLAFSLPGCVGLQGDEAQTLSQCFFVGGISIALLIFINCFVGLSRGVQQTALMNVSMERGQPGRVHRLPGAGVDGLGSLGDCDRHAVPDRRLLTRESGIPRLPPKPGDPPTPQGCGGMAKEYIIISPATALGGLAYALMNQSEAALVAIILRPELVPIMVSSRGSGPLAERFAGHDQLLVVRFVCPSGWLRPAEPGALCAGRDQVTAILPGIDGCCCRDGRERQSRIGRGRPTVLWWGGPDYPDRLADDCLRRFLSRQQPGIEHVAYVMKGSTCLVIESIVRVPLIIGLMHWLGLPGVPLATILTSAVSAVIVSRLMAQRLHGVAAPESIFSRTKFSARAFLIAASMVMCAFVIHPSWLYVLVSGAIVSIGGGLLLLRTDPRIQGLKASLMLTSSR